MSDIVSVTRRMLLQAFALLSGPSGGPNEQSHASQSGNANTLSEPQSQPESSRPSAGLYDSLTAVSNTLIPSSLNAIELRGYSTAGDGGGATYRRTATEPEHPGKLQSRDGAWWELARSEVNAKMFGAIEGQGDASTSIQTFFDYTSLVSCNKAVLAGDFMIGSGLVINAKKTFDYDFSVRLRAIAPVDIVLSIRDGIRMRFSGRIEIYGEVSDDFANRTCRIGLYIFNCGRACFGAIYTRYFSQWGVFQYGQVKSGSNNSLSRFESVNCIDCGSFKRAPMTGSFSNPFKSGKPGSLSQRTTITVDRMPPEDFEVRQMCLVCISNRLYYIAPDDFSDQYNQISLFPWLDISEGDAGTFYYIFGGALATVGNDNNVIDIGQIDAYGCGFALWDAALYGVVARGVVAQSCGIGIAIGRNITSSHKSSSIDGLYCEGNSFDIVQVTNDAINTTITCTYETHLSKCVSLASPRSAENLIQDRGFVALSVINGVHYFGSKPGSNLRDSQNNTRFGLSNSDIYLRDDWTIDLTADTDVNRLFGHDARPLFFIGSGPNQAPTGVFTFAPPPGWTVNGDVSSSYAGFYGPALFLIKYNFVGSDVQVRLAAGRDRAAFVTEIVKDEDCVIFPWSSSDLVIHSAIITADRTLTLSTTGAQAGATRFKISRQGTGSYVLQVGNLIGLPAESWCDIVYDGSRYVLISSGLLLHSIQ